MEAVRQFFNEKDLCMDFHIVLISEVDVRSSEICDVIGWARS